VIIEDAVVDEGMERVVLDARLEAVVLVTRELLSRSSSLSPDWQCLSSAALVSSWSLGPRRR
jgi:hypothetical protein